MISKQAVQLLPVFDPLGIGGVKGNRRQFRPAQHSAQLPELLVIADGDIARNDVNPRNGVPQPLGFDPFEETTFGNEDLLMNALHYMINEKGLITARNKDIAIRPLDRIRIAEERTFWQFLNLVVPVILIVIFGVVRAYTRKKRFTGFKTNGDAA